MAGLEERVERLEKALRRSRLFTYIRLSIYIILIIGVIAYAAGLYKSMDKWRFELSDAPRIGVSGVPVISVDMPLRIYNPDGPVMARLVYYRIYVNGYYSGDGFIPYLDLNSGWSEHVIRAEIDLSRAGCGVANAIYRGDKVSIRLEGYAMVDLKAFGRIPWRTVTVPFNITATNVTLPELPAEAKALLALYLYACNNSATLLELLSMLSETYNLTGLLPGTPNAPSGEEPSISVETHLTPKPLQGGFMLSVTITNIGQDQIVLENITYNRARILESPITLAPGETVTLTYNTTVVPGVLKVVTDKGTKTLIVGPGG